MTKTWRLAALAIVAMVAVISAGCGGTGSSSGGTSTAALAGTTATTSTTATASSTGTAGGSTAASHNSAATPRQRAVKFAECIRENGYPDFPDPKASGEFPTFGISVSPAVWTAALRACKDLQPSGSFGAHLSPKQLSAAREFAQCIRENGVKDFPDPVNGEPLVDTTKIPSTDTPGGMDILNAAMQQCGDLGEAAIGERR
jgi:hypothetical protein